jgi:hypothetical protein
LQQREPQLVLHAGRAARADGLREPREGGARDDDRQQQRQRIGRGARDRRREQPRLRDEQRRVRHAERDRGDDGGACRASATPQREVERHALTASGVDQAELACP